MNAGLVVAHKAGDKAESTATTATAATTTAVPHHLLVEDRGWPSQSAADNIRKIKFSIIVY